MGVETLKGYSYKSQPVVFKFSSQCYCKKQIGDFKIFESLIFNVFFPKISNSPLSNMGNSNRIYTAQTFKGSQLRL